MIKNERKYQEVRKMGNEPAPVWDDPIVAEVRAERDAYAASLEYDPQRIADDIRRREQAEERPVIYLAPRRVVPVSG